CLSIFVLVLFKSNDSSRTDIYTLSLHDALPIFDGERRDADLLEGGRRRAEGVEARDREPDQDGVGELHGVAPDQPPVLTVSRIVGRDGVSGPHQAQPVGCRCRAGRRGRAHVPTAHAPLERRAVVGGEDHGGMAGLWLQRLPDHEPRLGPGAHRLEGGDLAADLHVPRDLYVKEEEAVLAVPDVPAGCGHVVAVVLHGERPGDVDDADVDAGNGPELVPDRGWCRDRPALPERHADHHRHACDERGSRGGEADEKARWHGAPQYRWPAEPPGRRAAISSRAWALPVRGR